MIGKGILLIGLKFFFITIFLSLPPRILFSEDNKQPDDCLGLAVKRMKKIISLPDSKYLHTLDGQNVLLNEFHDKCLHLWPYCSLFKKFNYWQGEIRKEADCSNKVVILIGPKNL
jgi:hypothetical protein